MNPRVDEETSSGLRIESIRKVSLEGIVQSISESISDKEIAPDIVYNSGKNNERKNFAGAKY